MVLHEVLDIRCSPCYDIDPRRTAGTTDRRSPMAGKHQQQGGERSKFRILLVEGDVAPGDLSGLTQALANAMRPTQQVSRPAPPRLAPAAEIEVEAAEEM